VVQKLFSINSVSVHVLSHTLLSSCKPKIFLTVSPFVVCDGFVASSLSACRRETKKWRIRIGSSLSRVTYCVFSRLFFGFMCLIYYLFWKSVKYNTHHITHSHLSDGKAWTFWATLYSICVCEFWVWVCFGAFLFHDKKGIVFVMGVFFFRFWM